MAALRKHRSRSRAAAAMPQAVPLTQFLAAAGGAKTSWADEEAPDAAPALPSYARAQQAPAPAAPLAATKVIPTVGPFVVFVGNVSYDIEQVRTLWSACLAASTLGGACPRRRAARPRQPAGRGDRAGELTWRPLPSRSATWRRRSRNAGCGAASQPQLSAHADAARTASAVQGVPHHPPPRHRPPARLLHHRRVR